MQSPLLVFTLLGPDVPAHQRRDGLLRAHRLQGRICPRSRGVPSTMIVPACMCIRVVVSFFFVSLAPSQVDGKERYVFWVAPHVAFSGNNEVSQYL